MPRQRRPGAIPRQRARYTEFLDCGKYRTPPTDVAARISERDQREAADQRSPAQRLLNDPPLERSALSNFETVSNCEPVSQSKARHVNPPAWKVAGEERPNINGTVNVGQVHSQYAAALDPRPWLVKPK